MGLGDTTFADDLSAALEGQRSPDGSEAAGALLLESIYREYRNFRDRSVYVLFSGGLDTSFLAHFLHSIVRAKVTAISVDVGSILPDGSESLERARNRANQIGVPFKLLDGRSFLLEPFLSCIRAEGQLFRGHYPASSLSRTAIVRSVLDFAKASPPDAIVHGSNGFQNNAFRFFNSFKHYGDAANISVVVAAPHLNALFSREIAEWYLHGVCVPVPRHVDETIYSQDDNIFGLEAEDAAISIASRPFDVEDTLLRGCPSSSDGAREVFVSIEFRDGVPRSLALGDDNPLELQPLEILEELNRIGLRYRIGIHDYYEGRPIGTHVREVHVAPGMTVLTRAHHLLKIALLPPELSRELERLSHLWTELVVAANLWTHPLRRRADALFQKYNEGLTGTVRLRLRSQSIDLPTIHAQSAKRIQHDRPPATAEDVEGLYRYTHEQDDVGSVSSEFDDVREVCAALDRVVRSAYAFLASRPPQNGNGTPRKTIQVEPAPQDA